MIVLGEFEPGPLCFAEALLTFAVAYVIWRRFKGDRTTELKRMPTFSTLAFAAVGVGAISFIVRLAIPVGSTVAWLQLGYFPAYVLLFMVGCMAARTRLLERVTFADAKPWAAISLGLLILLPIVFITRGNAGSFVGGWTLNAAFYAFWDPAVAWGIMLTLLWSFRTRWTESNPLMEALARRAYAAYIVHPPVLVGLSLVCRGWTAPPLLKFGAVGLAASVAAFGAASILLLLPGARKVL